MVQRAIVRTIPAPVGGLNDINSIADMPPTDALVMDNIFPGTNSCSLRGGSVQWVSGLGAIGETLLAYNGINSKKLFVAAGTSIIDVTTSGTAGAAVLSGKSNARWDYVNFGGNAGNHLVAVNSADLPIYYNGSTWAVSGSGFATAITGVDASLFSSVAMFKNRLYFVEKNSLKCWYLGTNSIGGAASVIDFSGVARLGGKLVAITTIPTSAGQAIDDYFCAITSEGELLVYKGTDPASVSTFALVGVYRIGRPVANGTAVDGSRFIEKMGSDMIAITVDGFTTLQSALNNDTVAQSTTINKKIVNSVTRDTKRYKQNFGWQIVLAPNNNKLLINVPTGNGEYYQYVMNTITGSWCRFTGLNAYCWAYWNDELMAVMESATGSVGSAVYKVDVPGITTDNSVIPTYKVWIEQLAGYFIDTAITDDGQTIVAIKNVSDYPYISYDGGYTWSQLTSAPSLLYLACDISASGTNILLCTSTNAYYSTNSGGSWSNRASGGPNYTTGVISGDGNTIILCPSSDWIQMSINAGSTWTTLVGTSPLLNVFECSINHDGNVILFAGNTGAALTINRFSSFSYISIFSGHGCTDCSVSYTGDVMILIDAAPRSIRISTDYGSTWSLYNATVTNINSASVSGDGYTFLYTDLLSSKLYTSNDLGITWIENTGFPYFAGLQPWTSSCINYAGTKLVASSINFLHTAQ